MESKRSVYSAHTMFNNIYKVKSIAVYSSKPLASEKDMTIT